MTVNPQGKATRPNIVVFHVDAMVHSFMGSAGDQVVKTPALDALAAEGTMFTQSYSCSGVCTPSRASLMTGRYPIAHGVGSLVQSLPASEKTMGRYFQDAGYRTGYFGKTHYGRDDLDVAPDGWEQSFLVKRDYNNYLRDQGLDLRYPETAEIRHPEMRYWNVGTSKIPYEHYLEKVLADKTIDFIGRDQTRPFLCFVGNIAPHGPFSPPEPFDSMYDPAAVLLAGSEDCCLENKPPSFVRWVRQNRKYVSEPELRIFLAAVYGLISMVDRQLSRLVRALKDAGVYDDTVIVFTSDHGDFGSRYGIIGKSWCMDDCLMRVPLIISHPEHRRKGVSAVLTDNVDILPTLLECASISIPGAVQGRSLLPVIARGAIAHKEAVFGYNYFYNAETELKETMIRRDNWKLVQAATFKGELYDMENDPHETRNLIDREDYSKVASDLRYEMLLWHIANSGTTVADNAIRTCWEVRSRFYDEENFLG